MMYILAFTVCFEGCIEVIGYHSKKEDCLSALERYEQQEDVNITTACKAVATGREIKA